MSVLNNIAFQAYAHGETSPLTTAIQLKHSDMVSKLLSIGAKATIGFDEWIKAYLEKNSLPINWTAEDNFKIYQTLVCQPIIAAAGLEMGPVVEDLLAHGSDPLTLEKNAWGAVQNPQNAHYTMSESLLDIIQNKIKALRE